jgi:hypothetical protein
VSYLSVTDADRAAMLETIGVASVDELFGDIPDAMRYGRELHVPPALTEAELQRHLEELAGKNVVDEICFLGAGIYDHYVPAVVDAVLQRGELLEVRNELRLGQRRRHVEVAAEVDAVGDVPEQLVDRVDADRLEHRRAVGARQRQEVRQR